jgi:UrcA family protein
MKTALKWISCLTVASAVAFTTFSSSAAEPGDAVRTRTVKAWDIDFANPEDVQTLYGRVREAARDVCRTEARSHWKATRIVPSRVWTQRCTDEAVAKTVRHIGNPLLATLHETTTRGTASLR